MATKRTRVKWIVEREDTRSVQRDTLQSAVNVALDWDYRFRRGRPLARDPNTYWDEITGISIRRIKPQPRQDHSIARQSPRQSPRGCCDHCGTPAKRRYAVRIKGCPGISMVGSSCAKRFPRANTSDLIRSIQRDQRSQRGQRSQSKRGGRYLAEVLGLGYAVMPTRLSLQEFENEFRQPTIDPNDPNKRVLLNVTKRIKGKVFELYKWKGLGVIVASSALDTSFDPAARVILYDPYTGSMVDSLIGYQKTPLGNVVSQTLRKDKRVQEWLDAFPKWDPIAEHVTKIPATQWPATATMPPPVRDSGRIFDDVGGRVTDFRTLLKRSIDNSAYYYPILLGSYALSIQGCDGCYSVPNKTLVSPYQYESFEVRLIRLLSKSGGKFIKPTDIPGFPTDLVDMWEPGEEVAGYVKPPDIQRIYDHVSALEQAAQP